MDKRSKSEMKKTLVKRIVLFVCSAILLILCIAAYSLGWFTSDKKTGGDGISMSATGSFVISTVGDKKYEMKIAERLDDYLTENGYSDSSKVDVIWKLSADSNLYNTSDQQFRSLRPGSSGQIQFQVEAKTDKPVYLEFDFTMIPWSELVEPSTDSTEPTEAPSEGGQQENTEPATDISMSDEITKEMQDSAAPFLSTHIMLFTEKKNGHYSGRIANGVYRPKDPFIKGEPVTVTIYWVWPETLGHMILKNNDENISGDDTIFANDNAERNELLYEIGGKADDETKYPSHMSSYFLSTDPSKLSAETTNFRKVANDIINDRSYNMDYYLYFWRQYNKADEAIGNNIRYFILKMDAIEIEKEE